MRTPPALRILIAIGYLACLSMPARASTALSLPSPLKPEAIGSVSLHLVDHSRWDSLAPVRTHRSLMVTLWYPAHPSTAPPAPYLDDGVARVVDDELGVPAGTFESAHSHARSEASVEVPGGRGYPVVIYSPGFGSWRNASTALVEELVSHGFVVATIDHPYDAVAVEFPNHIVVKGRPLAMHGVAKTLTYASWYAMVQPLLAVRVADVNFVLDELAAVDAGRNPDAEGRNLPKHLTGALDLHRVGMFGHSLGGATMARVLQSGTRIRAGLSLDGPIPAATGTACGEQPIMLIRSVDPALERLTVASWTSATRGFCSWHRAVALRGSGHNDFTDLTVFARQLALGSPRRAAWALGSIDAGDAVEAERAYVVNFFERWLAR
jgi:hypothetical protein